MIKHIVLLLLTVAVSTVLSCKLGSHHQLFSGKKPVEGQGYVIPDLGMEFEYVKSGTFQMGSADDFAYPREQPVHEVNIGKGFWIGKYEVTQSEYMKLMGCNPSSMPVDSHPVENVKWTEAIEYCRKLTQRERRAGRLPDGYKYRLPTEAEWEYAAKGGQQSNGYTFSGSNNINEVAWYAFNSYSTHRRGQKQPNELGLYDMSGNVWEWCLDSWHEIYKNAPVNGAAWIQNTDSDFRIVRGGSWRSKARFCRSTFRSYNHAEIEVNIFYNGFRVVLGPANNVSLE